jgi:molecular chaperone GrpE
MEESKKSTAANASGDAEDHFELDLEEHSDSDVQDAIEQAAAAVARKSKSTASSSEDFEEDVELEEKGTASAVSDSELEGLRRENRALKERLMRTLADFDNFRKRTEREKASLGKFAIFDVVKDFLQVSDNLERAMAASGKLEDLKLGLEMVLKLQEDILRRHGVEKVESVNRPFDPTIHEAVSREESGKVEVATVTTELQPGYLLYDRLLRPAMVTVAVPASSPSPAPSSEENGDDEGEEKAEDSSAAENAEDEEASGQEEVGEEVEQLTD